MLIVGLMSGTSADGIDAALVEITENVAKPTVRVINWGCFPFSEEVRQSILRVCTPDRGSAAEICVLNGLLGEKFAEAAIAVCDTAGVALTEIDAVASHGQTIWHQPDPIVVGGQPARGTLQIGNPSIIAAHTGCKV